MFLAEIAGRICRCVGRRGAERGCLRRGRRRISTLWSFRGPHWLLRRRRLRGEARRWRRLQRRTASCLGLGLQTPGWPGRGAGGAGRRVPRTQGSGAAARRCAGPSAEVREAASALFLLSTAPAHRDVCILAGRGAHVARPPGLAPEVLRAVRSPAAWAWRGPGVQRHRGPRRQLSRPRVQGGRRGIGMGVEGEGTQAQWGELWGPPTRLPGRRRAGRPPRGSGHCQAGRRTQSLHGAALGVAHCGGPAPNGGIPRRLEEPGGAEEHRPPSTGRSVLTGVPGPPPGVRGGAPALSSGSSRGPRPRPDSWVPARPRCDRSRFLPPPSRRSARHEPPSKPRRGQTKQLALAAGGKGPRPGARCPGPAAGRAPSALSASFFPAGSGDRVIENCPLAAPIPAPRLRARL